MTHIDYLVIGHASCDLTPDGRQVGGTVSYASQTARILGCKTAVLTSAASDFDLETALPGVTIHTLPSAQSTTFENAYTPAGRVQTIHAVAGRIHAAAIPDTWRRAGIVHLAPLVNEVDPDVIHGFSNSLVGVTPQGWMRGWDENGRVYAQDWDKAEQILPLAAAVILSQEDLLNQSMLTKYRQWSKLLVLTQGAKGCTVFLGSEIRQIPAPPVTEQEPTGAGDIFAAAFLVRLWQTAGNPWEAARFANEIASQSVITAGLSAKMDVILQAASIK